jgi:homeobox-leucine zipper protein
MELGLSLGETMADAGKELVLGLGMGMGTVRREEEGGERRRKRELEEVATPLRRCGRSSPDPPVGLTLLSMVPSLGLPCSSPDTGE